MQILKRQIKCYLRWPSLTIQNVFKNPCQSQTQICFPNFAHGKRCIGTNNNTLRSNLKKQPVTVEDFEVLYTLTKEKFLCRY